MTVLTTVSGTVKATNTVCYNVNCGFGKPIEYNGTFYAAGYWNNQGSEVLMYDSTGLSLLVDLTPGQYFSVPRTTNPSHLTVYDDWFWFLTAGNPHPSSGNGNCLYRSNGTAAGTTPFVCDYNGELYLVEDGRNDVRHRHGDRYPSKRRLMTNRLVCLRQTITSTSRSKQERPTPTTPFGEPMEQPLARSWSNLALLLGNVANLFQ